jgi:Ca2+-transporting ATPase
MKINPIIINKSISWHNLTRDQVIALMKVDVKTGLSAADVINRQSLFGPNRLTEKKNEPFWVDFIKELREPMVLLLLATGVLYAI